ncbi:hypothetical protein HDU93_008486, partial [Gonapodya sp. JEL0774]
MDRTRINRGQYTQLSSDPKGENIVYTNGRSVFVRNLKNPEQAWEYTGHPAAATVARFSPSGFYVASADVNGNVRIWDTINDEHISKLEIRPISGKINDLAWDSESKRIIAVGEGRDKFGHAFLYDSGSSVGEIGGHSKAINGVSIRPVRPFKAVTASEDGTVNFFNGVPFKLASTLKDHTRFVHAAKFSPDGAHFVTVGADGKIYLYKGDTAEKLGDLNSDPESHKGSILAVSWSPDSKHVVTSSADCTAKIWDIAAGKVVQTVTFNEKSTFLDQQVGNVWTAAGYIVSLSLSGDLNYIEVGSSKPTRVVKGHQKAITALTKLSPTTLYSGSYDGLVLRWSLDTGVPQPIVGTGHSNQVNDMGVVGGKVITAGMDDTLRVVDEDRFESDVVSTKTVPKSISTSQHLAVIAGVGEITVLRDGRKLSSTEISYSGSAAAVHPSGTTVAVGGEDGRIRFYALDGASGALKEHGEALDANKAALTTMAYSPDGSLLAAADSQRKILVFDAPTGKLKLDEWVFHTARVNSLSWSPSGKRCVTGSLDTNVHVWSVDEPMKFIAIKNAHLESVNGVTFLDEDTIATGGQDGALRVWNLYKSKEIFLRELISNAADALDKIRFVSLTNKDALVSNEYLNITIRANKEANTLTIRDSGIGMTKSDLIKNLGTIAKSGTSDFIRALENNTADMNLIGQFGVGFYSIYLVADTVTVVSKNNADKQHIWESAAENSFTVIEDPRGDTLGRGTEITLYLKENAVEFLDENKLSALVHKYSQFINFPIYLWTHRTVTEEIPKAEAGTTDEKKESAEDDLDVEDVVEDEPPKTETITKEVEGFELMNENKPLWVRKRKDIKEEEYKDFYKAFTKDSQDPAAWIHFKAEGEHEFRSLLYAPAKAGNSMNAIDSVWNIKLYVRRVFITDELPGFLPRWLTFLKGLVDSDDFPLNVSRETLQNSDILKFIKNKIISKALEMFKSISSDEKKYKSFLKEYGTHLKVGVIEDRSFAKKLMKLLRFASTSKDFTSLDSYVERMKSKQAQIYLMSGDNVSEMKKSPFVEKVVARGYEVLLCDDPIDEYLFQNIFEYEGKPFQNVAKAGLKFGDESEDEENRLKDAEEKFKPLIEFFKSTLSEFIDNAVISNRLTKSPAAIVANSWGWT